MPENTTLPPVLVDTAVLERLANLAIQIGRYPPAKRNQYAHWAYVPWDLIETVRAELDAVGLEWRCP